MEKSYEKKQYAILKIIAGACIGMFLVLFVSAVIIVPKITSTFTQIEKIEKSLKTENIEQLMTDVGKFVANSESNLSDVTDKISQIDFDNLNNAIKNFSDAVGKMDIDELNRAIKNLSDVIEPIAKFFGRER